MPGRDYIFENNQYYHVFNRGVAKLPIFLDDADYSQALMDLEYYRFIKTPIKLSKIKRLNMINRAKILERLEQTGNKVVDLICFVFMPNHWHLLLRQVENGGISKFVSQFSNSYTRYFNTKYDRVGPVFQGVFKAVSVESGEQLLHLSKYIHLNPVVSKLVKGIEITNFKWSSYKDYINGRSKLCVLKPVLEYFKSPQEYDEFVTLQIDYAESLELIKHTTIDMEE